MKIELYLYDTDYYCSYHASMLLDENITLDDLDALYSWDLNNGEQCSVCIFESVCGGLLQ